MCWLGIINCYSKIGTGLILNTNASVDHDCQISDSVHISPGAALAGEVVVGSKTWRGMGALIKQQIRIGSKVSVGAGAVWLVISETLKLVLEYQLDLYR